MALRMRASLWLAACASGEMAEWRHLTHRREGTGGSYVMLRHGGANMLLIFGTFCRRKEMACFQRLQYVNVMKCHQAGEASAAWPCAHLMSRGNERRRGMWLILRASRAQALAREIGGAYGRSLGVAILLAATEAMAIAHRNRYQS